MKYLCGQLMALKLVFWEIQIHDYVNTAAISLNLNSNWGQNTPNFVHVVCTQLHIHKHKASEMYLERLLIENRLSSQVKSLFQYPSLELMTKGVF